MFAFLEKYPALYTLIIAPLVLGFFGAVVNAFTRKRTPEEYAAMPQRLAGFLRIMSALFPDPRKALDAAGQIVKDAPPANPTRSLQPGESVPPPTPKGVVVPPLPLILLLVAIAAVASMTPFALCSCSPASKPLVASNPDGADCLAERQKAQLTCVQKYATDPEINACREGAKNAIHCTTEAGVEAYVTSRDGGK